MPGKAVKKKSSSGGSAIASMEVPPAMGKLINLPEITYKEIIAVYYESITDAEWSYLCGKIVGTIIMKAIQDYKGYKEGLDSIYLHEIKFSKLFPNTDSRIVMLLSDKATGRVYNVLVKMKSYLDSDPDVQVEISFFHRYTNNADY